MSQQIGSRPPSAGLAPLETVGHPTPRIDAVERVTGRAKYTRDVHLPGKLYARVLRSPHPHARITAPACTPIRRRREPRA